jgi:hypothetical protein
MSEPFDQSVYACGEFRKPRQMLAEQPYDGHLSLHDDKLAQDLGFRTGPIEGPAHFSQFIPMSWLTRFWQMMARRAPPRFSTERIKHKSDADGRI